MFYLPNYVFYIFLSPKGRTGSNKIFIGMPIIPLIYSTKAFSYAQSNTSSPFKTLFLYKYTCTLSNPQALQGNETGQELYASRLV